MKKSLTAYRLIDPATGNKGDWTVVDDSGCTICIGVQTEYGYKQYDSYEGYHASTWAEKIGLKVEQCELTVELPE